eukprot:1439580-Amphidinium_carterae.1
MREELAKFLNPDHDAEYGKVVKRRPFSCGTVHGLSSHLFVPSQLLDMALLLVHRLRGQDGHNRAYTTSLQQTDLDNAAKAILTAV